MKSISQLQSYVLSILLISICSLSVHSQVAVGTITPNSSALLDLTNPPLPEAQGGLLIPRVALTTGTSSPAPLANDVEGMVIYNTATVGDVTPGYYVNNGSDWGRLATGTPSIDWTLSGNTGTTAGTNYFGTTDNAALRFKTVAVDAFEISGGNATNRGKLRSFTNGTAALPVYSWDADTDIGMYRINTDILGLSTVGAERTRFSTTSAIFNGPGNDYDFRVESVAEANMFFVDASTSRVGIQTNAPTHSFHVLNSGNIGATSLTQIDNAGTDGVALSSRNLSTSNPYNGYEGITDGIFTGVFGLGITGVAGATGADGVWGATNDWQNVGVVGSRFNSGGPDSGFGGLFLNDLGYTGGLFNVSDRRLKTNIRNMDNALDLILNLRPVIYDFKINEYATLGLKSSSEHGFIAQEVQEILPTIVKEKSFPTNRVQNLSPGTIDTNESETILTMDYTRIIPILTKAIQEQQVLIEAQNRKIEALERSVEMLKQ